MNLKNNISTVKYTAISAALLVMAANTVQAETFTFSMDTIAQVGITERQALSLNTALKLTPLAECAFPTLVAATHDWTTGEAFAITLATQQAQAAVGAAGCADTTSTTSNFGHYLIAGASNTGVTIELVSGGSDDGTSFDFEPAGMYDNDNSSGVAGTGAALIAKDTPTAVTTDSSGNIGLIVGGKVIIGVGGLTAGTTGITASYDINVAYQ